MARKKDNYYFDAFVTMVDYSRQCAEMLDKILNNFDADQLGSKMKEIHEIEHAGDRQKHEMMNKLTKEFITPIEQEDIVNLAQEIDEVTDSIEDVLIRIYMFNIKTIRPEALEFSKKIVACCSALEKAMEDFHHFKKSAVMHANIVEINRHEEEADALYMEAVRGLYLQDINPIEVTAWTETYTRMEKCCDACEHVVNIMESVALKNT